MINLLPQEAKRGVRREYIARVGVTYLWLSVVGALIVGTLLVSPLTFIYFQTNVVEDQYREAADTQAALAVLVDEINQANQQVAEVSQFMSTEALLPITEQLASLSASSIVINTVEVSRAEDRSIATIEVNGIASTREALASFRDRIEAAPQFGEVVLPLANLARDRDVPFSLTIPVLELTQ